MNVAEITAIKFLAKEHKHVTVYPTEVSNWTRNGN